MVRVDMTIVKNAKAGALPEVQAPAEPENRLKCDRDQACECAKFRISTRNGPVFLCGHHFHEHELFLMANKFEVIKVNV
jgi:hypothetical protein